MTTTNLNTVAVDVVGQYALAGKHLVQAYRLGTQRIVDQVSERYAALVNASSLPLVDGSLRTNLLNAQQQLTSLFVGGVAHATEQADVAIDKITSGTTEGIKRLNGVGDRFAAVVGAPVVETMTKVNLPIATMSLTIAGQVVAHSKRLVEQVAGDDAATVAGTTRGRGKRAAA